MPSMDMKSVVVGEVVEGLDVFRKLESMGSSSGEPRHMVEIYDCGEVARAIGPKNSPPALSGSGGQRPSPIIRSARIKGIGLCIL